MQRLLSKFHSSLKCPVILGIADSRCGAENVEGESGTACGSRKQTIAQWLMGSCQKDTGGCLQEIPAAKKEK